MVVYMFHIPVKNAPSSAAKLFSFNLKEWIRNTRLIFMAETKWLVLLLNDLTDLSVTDEMLGHMIY